MSDFIKDFWNRQAITHGASASASWVDEYAVKLEIDTIGRCIKHGDKVLDVGCANGHATFEQLERKDINIIGCDYSVEMIKQADEALRIHHINKFIDKANISFQVADIKKLPFDDETFDVTYTTRVLINLPNWEEQKKGIAECIRVTKKGGMIILSEAFYEPLVLLNSLRQLKNLEPLVEHDFNRYLKKPRLESLINERGNDWECIDFSSIYYLGSRFLRELVKENGSSDPTSLTYPDYSKNPVNKWFYEMEENFNGGGFGIQQAYIIHK